MFYAPDLPRRSLRGEAEEICFKASFWVTLRHGDRLRPPGSVDGSLLLRRGPYLNKLMHSLLPRMYHVPASVTQDVKHRWAGKVLDLEDERAHTRSPYCANRMESAQAHGQETHRELRGRVAAPSAGGSSGKASQRRSISVQAGRTGECGVKSVKNLSEREEHGGGL